MITCPDKTCNKCQRLLDFRKQNEVKFPTYFNGPVPSFGSADSELLVVGMAPGLNGANQTARPFTGDYAGDILYPALKKFGFAKGDYQRRPDDGFELVNTRVTNAVRCVPPQNKLVADEVNNCMGYLIQTIHSMPNIKVILSLGSVAHEACVKALGYKKSQFKFAHGAVHVLPDRSFVLLNSYHTSRYNINTRVLSNEAFEKIVSTIHNLIK